MAVTGIGSVQTYIYNSQTGRLSTKDGSADEFVDYFNGELSEKECEERLSQPLHSRAGR